MLFLNRFKIIFILAGFVFIHSCSESTHNNNYVTRLRISFPPGPSSYMDYMEVMMEGKKTGKVIDAQIKHSETIFTIEFFNIVEIPRGSAFVMDPPDLFGNNFIWIRKSKQTTYYKNNELIKGEIGKTLSESVSEAIKKGKKDSSLNRLSKEINDVIQVVDSIIKSHKK